MRHFKLLFVLALLSPTIHAQVLKCTDPKTGNVTYSDGGCAASHKVAAIRIQPSSKQNSNSFSDSRVSQQAQQDYYGQSFSTSADSNQRRANSNPMAEQARKDAYREASTPIKGARGLTANQLRTLAALGGVDVPAPEREHPQSSVPNQPRMVTSCDEGGCWDTQGGRYNRGAGNTYIPTTGGSCQGVGNQMQCN